MDENLGFLTRHRHPMLGETHRETGWFIGSGVVEAECRSVLGKQLKQSESFWSEQGAETTPPRMPQKTMSSSLARRGCSTDRSWTL